MPLYDFRCGACEARRDVLVDYATSRQLELVCVDCGAAMRVAPVLSARFLLAATHRQERGSASAPVERDKACGHHHACRCAVKLKRPNPFRGRLGAGVDTAGRD